ncbi:MAG: arylamine N-acetyltransferase [Acidimicrobiia bacterium]
MRPEGAADGMGRGMVDDGGRFDLEGYLSRLGVTERPDPTLAYLTLISRAQSESIPFENLDPLAGVPVRLDPDSIWDKTVTRRRGGYCFELNLLLAQAMRAIGFNATPMLARVIMGRPDVGPRGHLLHVVDLPEGEHLVDVGFGGPGFVEPIPLEAGTVFSQDGVDFRLATPVAGEYLLQRMTAEGWLDLYCFDRSRVVPLDIEMANFFYSTHPMVPFTNQLMCMFYDAEGLFGFREGALVYFNTDLSVRRREELDGSEHLARVLDEQFGLAVPPDLIKRVWQRLQPK